MGKKLKINTRRPTFIRYSRVKLLTPFIGQLSGRLSEDLDNTDLPWTFDWYCTTPNGGSCPAFDNSGAADSLTTLESVLDEKNLRKPELVVNGDLQPPGKYIFTLLAAKGKQKSEANATVSIISQHVPTIQVLTLSNG